MQRSPPLQGAPTLATRGTAHERGPDRRGPPSSARARFPPRASGPSLPPGAHQRRPGGPGKDSIAGCQGEADCGSEKEERQVGVEPVPEDPGRRSVRPAPRVEEQDDEENPARPPAPEHGPNGDGDEARGRDPEEHVRNEQRNSDDAKRPRARANSLVPSRACTRSSGPSHWPWRSHSACRRNSSSSATAGAMAVRVCALAEPESQPHGR